MVVGPSYLLERTPNSFSLFSGSGEVPLPLTSKARVWGTTSYIPPMRQYLLTPKVFSTSITDSE